MLERGSIAGLHLPERTLCLTYDDGPGPDSAAIGAFLAERGVRATFFVVGKYAEQHPEVLAGLHAAGHIIGNHTYDHPDMPYYVAAGGDVREQIIRTDGLIRRYSRDGRVFLRATYGKWSPEVADELNIDLRSSLGHVGPVYWEVPGIDCHCWRLGQSVEEAEQQYLAEIERHGGGILVMHDSVADMDAVAERSRTLELTRSLVPRLQGMGYRFIGLDEIDDPRLTAARDDSFALRSPAGAWLAGTDAAGEALRWVRGPETAALQLRLEDHGLGRLALRTPSGNYLSVDARHDDVVRLADARGPAALFHSVPLRDGQLMLRSYDGNYLAGERGNGTPLRANAPFMRQAWALRYRPRLNAYERPVSLGDRLRRLQRSARFIRSKLLPA
jgi:peptidoglycan/xylan/chitin deacetylase (PgdA/CDA1 family)